jgi:hypothetical protein
MKILGFIKLILAGAIFAGLYRYGPFQDNIVLNVVIAVLVFVLLTSIGKKK